MSVMREQDLETGVEAIRVLSEEIGPRPSASAEEAAAALYVSTCLVEMGLIPVTEEFRSSRSFGPSYLMTFGLALLAGALKRGKFRYITGALAGLLGIAEGRFSRLGPSAVTRWRRSRNVSVAIEPIGEAKRTICLVCHLDSSRSGMMFHPAVTPYLGQVVTLNGVALLVQALDPLIGRGPGRFLVLKARALCGIAFGLVLEREIRGENVAGANDNASGVGACLALASRLVREPLESSRVMILFTGSEESGVHGMNKFLRQNDTDGWLFVNFDGVSARASLRVLSKEGGPLGSVDCDPELLAWAEAVGRVDPELKAEPLAHGSGLPYDATPVLMKGGRAISIVNQDGAIPDYHWPTDRFDRVSHLDFERAISFSESLLEEIDRS